MMLCEPLVVHELTERPPGFIPPNLSPAGLRLVPEELGERVYALMANQIPKDNNGLIVGDDAALVIDSGVTPDIGRQIQEVAAELTDRPIRYLANTTYHGDHTFGNTAFGPEVTIFSSRHNRAAMTDLAAEKRIRGESMDGDAHALNSVVDWRKPDVVFDRFTEIDLGGRRVQLWHFGPGNGSGDTVVYVPDARVAFTGNTIGPAGAGPMALIGDPVGYARTVRAMTATLPAETLVPGHAFHTPAEPAVSWLLTYLENLAAEVGRRKEAGQPVEEMYEEIPVWGMEIPSEATDPFSMLRRSFHHLNILLTYRWLDGAAIPAVA